MTNLYPNFLGAYRESVKYFQYSNDAEEKKEQEKKIRVLEGKMGTMDVRMNEHINKAFGDFKDELKISGLKFSDEIIKNVKRKVLDNMRQHV